MNQHRPEVADVLRSYTSDYEQIYGLSAQQRRVTRDLCACRTAALGGHKSQCNRCGHEHISYNSCRNRHCPKCQAGASARWLELRAIDLLDVPYAHVVFTLPHELGPLALQNKRLLYGMLFRAASETLQTIARDPKHLGADIGFIAVLHTWGQRLEHHPHLHCLVPAGGIVDAGTQWIPCKKNFFLPVRVLGRMFRGKFLAYLQHAFDAGALDFHGRLHRLAAEDSWTAWRRKLYSGNWVVYAKPPFGGAPQLLKYLARYTHRVAIGNRRLHAIDDGKITFTWKDYARDNCRRTTTIEATEFVRRFLLHVLPSGFMRIRHYGFLANRQRSKRLARIRQLLEQQAATPRLIRLDLATDSQRCPWCGRGRLILIQTLAPRAPEPPAVLDSS